MEKPNLDPELLERLCKDDREAQEIFWRDFHPYLCSQVFNQGVRSKEDIEEIVEDVFVRVFRSIGKFRQQSRFTTWLYALTQNTIKDYYKSPKNRALSSEVEISAIEDQWVSPDGNTRKVAPAEEGGATRPVVHPDLKELSRSVSAEGLKRIYTIIERLPMELREAALFRFILLFSNKEAALMIGRTESATKSLATRALKALRQILKDDPYFTVRAKGGN